MSWLYELTHYYLILNKKQMKIVKEGSLTEGAIEAQILQTGEGQILQPGVEVKSTAGSGVAEKTVFSILLAISFSHLLNDTIQSLIPSTYPLLKKSMHLNFGQLGLITFCFQLTASLLQPFVGMYTDRKPQPYSLATGMGFTLTGLAMLSRAGSFPMVLVSVALVGIGSSIFH